MSYRWLCLSGLVLLAACSPKGQTATSTSTDTSSPSVAMAPELSCEGPVMKDDTAQTLKDRFGADAEVGTIAGPEGMDAKGVILFGKDPKKRIEVHFWDEDKLTHVSDVALGSEATAWTGPFGLKIGSPVAEVQAANGKPFTIGGFGWDYGGYASDYKGGKLGSVPGGCLLSLRFDNPNFQGDMPQGISGEVTLSSDQPEVKAYAPVVTELSIGWPAPAGMSDTE